MPDALRGQDAVPPRTQVIDGSEPATMWVLRIQPRSSARTVSAINSDPSLQQPSSELFCFVLGFCFQRFIFKCVVWCVCVLSIWMCKQYVHAGTQGTQRYCFPGLELEAYMDHPLWVLGPELWSSVRTACTLNHGDISPGLKVCFC